MILRGHIKEGWVISCLGNGCSLDQESSCRVKAVGGKQLYQNDQMSCMCTRSKMEKRRGKSKNFLLHKRYIGKQDLHFPIDNRFSAIEHEM